MTTSIKSKGIASVIKTFPVIKSPGQDDFTEGFYQTIKELIPIFPEN